MKNIVITAIILTLAGTFPALAETPGRRQIKADRGRSMNHLQGFVVRKGIRDNYTVIFHIMRSPEGMRYSEDQYHLMVVVEKDHKPVTGLQMISRVVHPNGITEQKPMIHVGEWYMALYNLHEQGRHWISVQFNISGKQYAAGTYYPEMDFSGASQ